MMRSFMKVIAEIVKTISIVKNENALIDIKINLNLLSIIPALIHRM